MLTFDNTTRWYSIEDKYINWIHYMLKNKKQLIDIGSKVRLIFNDGTVSVLEIGKSPNLDQGIVSCESPIGKALLGHQQGEEISYYLIDRCLSVKILEIR